MPSHPQPQSDFAPIWHFIIIAMVGGSMGALLTVVLEGWLR